MCSRPNKRHYIRDRTDRNWYSAATLAHAFIQIDCDREDNRLRKKKKKFISSFVLYDRQGPFYFICRAFKVFMALRLQRKQYKYTIKTFI